MPIHWHVAGQQLPPLSRNKFVMEDELKTTPSRLPALAVKFL